MASFSWDLVRQATKDDLGEESTDVLFCFIHWRIMSQLKLKCVGNGECFSMEHEDEAPPSELLPKDWNAAKPRIYALKYRHAEKTAEKYLVKAIVSAESEISIAITIIRVNDEMVATLSIDPVKSWVDEGKLDVQRYEELTKKIDNGLIEPFVQKDNEEKKQQTHTHHPEREQPVQPVPDVPNMPFPMIPGIGNRDLDPFGGNIFDPFRRQNPGGPRFDPPGPGFTPRHPLGPRGSRGPRGPGGLGDEFPPPGFGGGFGGGLGGGFF